MKQFQDTDVSVGVMATLLKLRRADEVTAAEESKQPDYVPLDPAKIVSVSKYEAPSQGVCERVDKFLDFVAEIMYPLFCLAHIGSLRVASAVRPRRSENAAGTRRQRHTAPDGDTTRTCGKRWGCGRTGSSPVAGPTKNADLVPVPSLTSTILTDRSRVISIMYRWEKEHVVDNLRTRGSRSAIYARSTVIWQGTVQTRHAN